MIKKHLLICTIQLLNLISKRPWLFKLILLYSLLSSMHSVRPVSAFGDGVLQLPVELLPGVWVLRHLPGLPVHVPHEQIVLPLVHAVHDHGEDDAHQGHQTAGQQDLHLVGFLNKKYLLNNTLKGIIYQQICLVLFPLSHFLRRTIWPWVLPPTRRTRSSDRRRGRPTCWGWGRRKGRSRGARSARRSRCSRCWCRLERLWTPPRRGRSPPRTWSWRSATSWATRKVLNA